MNAAYLPAIAALTGSAVGGLTSFLSTWLGLSGQIKAQLLLNDKARRQELYRDFINAASERYVNSLMSDAPDPGQLVSLYAMVSRMRTLSSLEVCEEADKIVKTILETYTRPNKDIAGIRTMVNEQMFDPMRHFSEACRAELETLR